MNDFVASRLLRYLQIASPVTEIVHVSEEFLSQTPTIYFESAEGRRPVLAGPSFGSRYPGDPKTVAVYDVIPDPLFNQVVNADHFLGALVLDKWTANSDARQCVYVRTRQADWARKATAGSPKQWFALMIDQGLAFNGEFWNFPATPLTGLYHKRSVYACVRSLDDFEPWISQVAAFPTKIASEIANQVPSEWVSGDKDYLNKLLEKLLRRCLRVHDTIRECRDAAPSIFPNWR